MLLGRTSELKQLNEAYLNSQSQGILLYGRTGIGKTCLSLSFTKELPFFYYCCRELSETEQLLKFSEETGEACDVNDPSFSYYRIIKKIADRSQAKTVFIFDEVHFIIKGTDAFKNAFLTVLKDQELNGKIMFLFLSSSVNWVENSLVEDLGLSARMLSQIIKLKELSFMELMDRFPNMGLENTICAEAVLGGVPGLLDLWEPRLSIRENIKRLCLSKNAPLYYEPERILKSELRELPAYNAILSTMASGHMKLNEIFRRTGFSRPKISVYIKNLIELDIVEKVFSFEAGNRDTTQKGIYRIKDRFIYFWYRYIFPNISLIEMGKGDEVYDKIIVNDFDNLVSECFSDVCFEFVRLMSELGKLSSRFTVWGKWYGKTGNIDIVAQDADENMLAGFCSFDDEPLDLEKFEKYKELLKTAGIRKCEMYVFAKNGFEKDVKARAAVDRVKLINMDEL